MGQVMYVSRKTNDEVQADFPLHPTLIKATRADGSEFQSFRADWDAEYSQKLPELPKVDDDTIPVGDPLLADQDYKSPTLVKLSQPQPLPASHNAWFSVIYDKLLTLDKKIDQVIDVWGEPAVKRDAPDVEIAAHPPTNDDDNNDRG